ncbi:hypothetical protein HMPREF9477_02169 [Lachnospiraceae bacterium 2_1_46FAA]|nr:hypothetical protein HMPREF9477_02169 [Lachnospiraceae bacterium 2_1_46FAA]
MTNKLKYHKNYTEFGEPYQLVLPLNLEGLIPDDDSVRLLSHELEDLDYSLLYQAYSAKGRNPAVDPKTMFKILTYAYSQNIYSSRKIETACKRDINFMWLLAGQKAPDHSTIARFRTGFLADACENLFYQMVRRLEEAGELSKETVFIDGTKLEACANKYTFVWKKSVGKMGRKNVQEDTGGNTASEQRIYEGFFGCFGNKDTGFTENRLFFRRTLSNRPLRFCSWTWKTEKQKPTVF